MLLGVQEARLLVPARFPLTRRAGRDTSNLVTLWTRKSTGGAFFTAQAIFCISFLPRKFCIIKSFISPLIFQRIKAFINDLLSPVHRSFAERESQSQRDVLVFLFTSPPDLIMLFWQCLVIFIKLAENHIAQISLHSNLEQNLINDSEPSAFLILLYLHLQPKLCLLQTHSWFSLWKTTSEGKLITIAAERRIFTFFSLSKRYLEEQLLSCAAPSGRCCCTATCGNLSLPRCPPLSSIVLHLQLSLGDTMRFGQQWKRKKKSEGTLKRIYNS